MTPGQKKQVSDYLTACHRRPFRFGQWDCALFVADVLAIIGGRDVAGALRGTYDSREGYLAALPAPLAEMLPRAGLTPCRPMDGAAFWMPNGEEGGLGILWQGRLYQAWTRGARVVTADISTLKFYSWPQH